MQALQNRLPHDGIAPKQVQLPQVRPMATLLPSHNGKPITSSSDFDLSASENQSRYNNQPYRSLTRMIYSSNYASFWAFPFLQILKASFSHMKTDFWSL